MTSAGIRWTSRLLFMVACVYARDVSAQGGTAPAPSVPEAGIRTAMTVEKWRVGPMSPASGHIFYCRLLSALNLIVLTEYGPPRRTCCGG
jgi:hypothetical protein